MPLPTDFWPFRWASPSGGGKHKDMSDALHRDRHSDAHGDGDQRAFQECQPLRLGGHCEAGGTPTALHVGDGFSIQALASACAFEIGLLTMRVAPTVWSQSHDVIERFQQTLFAQVRTMRIATASRLVVGQQVAQVDRPISPRIVKHLV